MSLNRLKIKHDQLRMLDGDNPANLTPYQVFGSSSHQYRHNSPLSASELAGFEQVHRIVLPIDYKNFLMAIGNGGSGPGYGLFPLSNWNYDLKFLDSNHLLTPFPHTETWNLDAENGSSYFSNEHITGSMRISDYGCAIYYLLVVSGPQAGRIWVDDRASDYGIYPAVSALTGQPLNFITWYDEWLTESLQKFNR